MQADAVQAPAVQAIVARPDLWANFIWPAYALTLAGLVGLLVWAYFSMRGAEKRADAAKPKGPDA